MQDSDGLKRLFHVTKGGFPRFYTILAAAVYQRLHRFTFLYYESIIPDYSPPRYQASIQCFAQTMDRRTNLTLGQEILDDWPKIVTQ